MKHPRSSKLRSLKKQRRGKAKPSQPALSSVRRLFIDPASISSGWAYYVGRDLKASGTIAADKKLSLFARLDSIWRQYRATIVNSSVDEVHIEQLPRMCHIYTHYSVATIGHALLLLGVPGVAIKGDIPVKSWQKHTNWGKIKGEWKKGGMASEDELAAICMGKYYTERIAP